MTRRWPPTSRLHIPTNSATTSASSRLGGPLWKLASPLLKPDGRDRNGLGAVTSKSSPRHDQPYDALLGKSDQGRRQPEVGFVSCNRTSGYVTGVVEGGSIRTVTVVLRRRCDRRAIAAKAVSTTDYPSISSSATRLSPQPWRTCSTNHAAETAFFAAWPAKHAE